jgi:hypothetical protein
MTEFTKKNINDTDYIKSAFVVLNPLDNGGESITLECDFFDDGMYTRININLNCYCYGSHSTSICLGNIGVEGLEKSLIQMKKIKDSIQKLRTFTV